MVYGEQWEYKTIPRPTDKELNDLGFEGWELVCVIYDSEDWTKAYLKRKKG